MLVSPATRVYWSWSHISSRHHQWSVSGGRGASTQPIVAAVLKSCFVQEKYALRDRSSNSQLEDEAIMTHCFSYELLCAFFSLLTEWLM